MNAPKYIITKHSKDSYQNPPQETLRARVAQRMSNKIRIYDIKNSVRLPSPTQKAGPMLAMCPKEDVA